MFYQLTLIILFFFIVMGSLVFIFLYTVAIKNSMFRANGDVIDEVRKWRFWKNTNSKVYIYYSHQELGAFYLKFVSTHFFIPKSLIDELGAKDITTLLSVIEKKSSFFNSMKILIFNIYHILKIWSYSFLAKIGLFSKWSLSANFFNWKVNKLSESKLDLFNKTYFLNPYQSTSIEMENLSRQCRRYQERYNTLQ